MIQTRILIIFPMICATIFITVAAHAADKSLTKVQLEKLLIGHTVYFEYGAKSTFKANGSYQYREAGNVSRGQYTIGDGTVCIEFKTTTRCDRYVKSGNEYILINRGGRRFPITIK